MFLDGGNIMSHTPATGQSVVTQLQNRTNFYGAEPNSDGVVPSSLPSQRVMLHDKENYADDYGSDWLHRNDVYQRQRFSRQMTLTQMSGVDNTQLSTIATRRTPDYPLGIQG